MLDENEPNWFCQAILLWIDVRLVYIREAQDENAFQLDPHFQSEIRYMKTSAMCFLKALEEIASCADALSSSRNDSSPTNVCLNEQPLPFANCVEWSNQHSRGGHTSKY